VAIGIFQQVDAAAVATGAHRRGSDRGARAAACSSANIPRQRVPEVDVLRDLILFDGVEPAAAAVHRQIRPKSAMYCSGRLPLGSAAAFPQFHRASRMRANGARNSCEALAREVCPVRAPAARSGRRTVEGPGQESHFVVAIPGHVYCGDNAPSDFNAPLQALETTGELTNDGEARPTAIAAPPATLQLQNRFFP